MYTQYDTLKRYKFVKEYSNPFLIFPIKNIEIGQIMCFVTNRNDGIIYLEKADKNGNIETIPYSYESSITRKCRFANRLVLKKICIEL